MYFYFTFLYPLFFIVLNVGKYIPRNNIWQLEFPKSDAKHTHKQLENILISIMSYMFKKI